MIDIQIESENDAIKLGFSDSHGNTLTGMSAFISLEHRDALRLVRAIVAHLDFERDLARTKANSKQGDALVTRFFSKRNRGRRDFVAGQSAKKGGRK